MPNENTGMQKGMNSNGKDKSKLISTYKTIKIISHGVQNNAQNF